MPQYTPSITLVPPFSISKKKIKKGQNPICTFHLHPSHRHTDAPTCLTEALTLYIISLNLNPEALPS